MARWPPPQYRLRMEFDVPPEFAFRWCTDYQHDDSSRSQETFDRAILSRSRRRVVFEDLWREGKAWGWRHSEVTLHPPHHWHADSFGNIREASIDYRLTPLPGGRSRFDLRMLRRPTKVYPKQPPRSSFEKGLRTMWTNYHREMLRDYRRAGRSPKGRRSGRKASR